MKRVFASAVVASALFLSACGGPVEEAQHQTPGALETSQQAVCNQNGCPAVPGWNHFSTSGAVWWPCSTLQNSRFEPYGTPVYAYSWNWCAGHWAIHIANSTLDGYTFQDLISAGY